MKIDRAKQTDPVAQSNFCVHLAKAESYSLYVPQN